MEYKSGHFEDEDFKEFVAGAALGIIVEKSKGSPIPTVRYFTHEKVTAPELANTHGGAVTRPVDRTRSRCARRPRGSPGEPDRGSQDRR